MTASPAAALRQLFALFARPAPDGALRMRAAELAVFLQALGARDGVPAAAARLLARYGAQAPHDAAAGLDFAAFSLLVAQEPLGPAPPPNEDGAADTELARVIARADGDGDGALSAAEVAALLAADGRPVGDAEVSAVLEEAGAAGKNAMSLAQFIALNGTQTR